MANRNPHGFAHRSNDDGSWDSICLRCCRTVATAARTIWLVVTENNHTCALIDLHLWGGGSLRIRLHRVSGSPHC